jgi:hypothetical protein
MTKTRGASRGQPFPQIFKDMATEVLTALKVERGAKKWIRRLASVQVVLMHGEGKDETYPSNAIAPHKDVKHWPQGGVCVVFLFTTEGGAMRTVSFWPDQPDDDGAYFLMIEGSAYIMYEGIFNKAKTDYRHAAETHLKKGETAFLIILRFWTEKEAVKFAPKTTESESESESEE